jgi:polysaccharide biosynthesis/export protein
MRVKIFLVVAILLSAVSVALGQGQGQEQQPQNVPTTSQPPSSPPSMDNQGGGKYLLGPGDVLDIRFFGQSDMNTVAQVDGDGNITSLPFLNKPIIAKCRTEKDVQRDVVTAYQRLIKNPQVSVRVSERNSRQPATVFGAVRQPTRVEMKRKVRLNELLAVAGGFTERAAGTIQILHTEPLMCPEPGEEAEAAPIEGTKLPLQLLKISDLRSGNPAANPVIRPGDYVQITEAEPVYITGSVNAPGGIYLREQLMLSKALGMVGGPRREAKTSDIRIYRQVPGSANQEIIHADLAAIRKNQKPDVLLQPYDVIDVPEANPFGSQRILSTLTGAFTGGVNSLVASGLSTRVLY